MDAMKRSGGQYKLFETGAELPIGFRYRPDFITEDEEELLLSFIAAQDMKRVSGGQGDRYRGKRHYKHFGWWYDEKNARFVIGPALPKFLRRFARRIEKWLALPRGRVAEALINEYPNGYGIGWHQDKEPFAHVVGISLAGWSTMRLRKSPARTASRRASPVESLELEPRSVYVLEGPSRTDYQHSIAPTRTLRYSITFRTLPKNIRVPPLRK